MPSRRQLIEGISCVIGATLIHLTFGYFYTISNMGPYMISYFMHRDPTVRSGDSMFWTTVTLCFQGFSMPVAGFLSKKVHFRILTAISIAIHSLSIITTYWSIQGSFVGSVITYSVLQAIGFGLAYAIVFQLAAAWFPNKRGLIIGIISGGFGAGSIVFTPVQKALINPDNIKPNQEGIFEAESLLNRIPIAFVYLGFIIFTIQVVALIMLRKKPVDEASLAKGEEIPVISLKSMLTKPEFYLIWFVLLFNTIPVNVITGSYKAYGNARMRDDYFMTGISTMSGIFNALGRITWGSITDWLSFKASLLLMLFLLAGAQLTFPLIMLAEGGLLKALMCIWVAMLFFAFSGNFVLMPAMTSRLFGPVNLSFVYGFVFTGFTVGSMVSLSFKPLISMGAFEHMYYGAGFVSVLNFILVCFAYDPGMPELFKRLFPCSKIMEKSYKRFLLSHGTKPAEVSELVGKDERDEEVNA